MILISDYIDIITLVMLHKALITSTCCCDQYVKENLRDLVHVHMRSKNVNISDLFILRTVQAAVKR